MAAPRGEDDDPPDEQPRVAQSSVGPRPVFRLGRPKDLEDEREKTRRALALILAALLFLTAILLIGLTAWKKIDIEEAKDLAASVLSPVVAVTGTALGFYFGGHRGGTKSG